METTIVGSYGVWGVRFRDKGKENGNDYILVEYIPYYDQS